MKTRLKIALAQVNSTVGDLEGNREIALAAISEAGEQGADLIVFPELFLTGYPPEDLVFKTRFQEDARRTVEAVVRRFADAEICGVLPTIWSREGRLYNAAIVFQRGRILGEVFKNELPNYGVFDEKRVFASGGVPTPVEVDGIRFGVLICEDMWHKETAAGLKEQGAEILLVPNGSPFDLLKEVQRQHLAQSRADETGLPLVYVNTVGGQDELVFDGGSFVVNPEGRMAYQGHFWAEGTTITEWEKKAEGWRCLSEGATFLPSSGTSPGAGAAPPEDANSGAHSGAPASDGDIYQALLIGLRDYVEKNGFPSLVLGLSGGVDSALSAAVAVDALGAGRVRCVMMPSRFTSDESLEDASLCASLLGVALDTVLIEPAMVAYDAMLKGVFRGRERDVTEENIQARIRGQILMAISNKFGSMVLTTGNKSEMAVGYTTLYGDMCGGFSVLKDVYKTMVYRLAAWRNQHQPRLGKGPAGAVIPERILTKAPTAELRQHQTDQDSLPSYAELDAILSGLVEEELGLEVLTARGHDPETVHKIQNLLYSAEYKRRQAPPGVKITPKNFGRDRRYPITNRYRDGSR